jgi:hypothetical protein
MALNHPLVPVFVVLAALSALPAWAADENQLEVYQQGDISYVSGGIGKEERDALQATQANYNLRVMNADKTGHFSGDTRIIIRDLQHNILLDVTSGPLFYANMPRGKYVVEGFINQQSKKQRVTIAKGKPALVRFMWLENMSDALLGR